MACSALGLKDSMALFQSIECAILEPMQNTMVSVSEKFSSFLGPILTLCITLYIILMGYSLMRGVRHYGPPVVIGSFINIGFIVFLALNAGNYQQYVAGPLSKAIPNQLGAVITSTDAVSASNMLDSFYGQIGVLTARVWEKSTYVGMFEAALYVGFTVLFSLVFLISAFCLVMYSKLILLMILSLGPVFVCCYLFEATKSYGTRFIDSCVTLIILQLLVFTLVSALALLVRDLTASVLTQKFSDMATMLPALFKIWSLCLFSAVVLSQLPYFAGSLGGGLTANTQLGFFAGAIKAPLSNLRTAKTFAHRFSNNPSASSNARASAALGRMGTTTPKIGKA